MGLLATILAIAGAALLLYRVYFRKGKNMSNHQKNLQLLTQYCFFTL